MKWKLLWNTNRFGQRTNASFATVFAGIAYGILYIFRCTNFFPGCFLFLETLVLVSDYLSYINTL